MTPVKWCGWFRWGEWGFWVRVFGYGPWVGWSRSHITLFSEQYGGVPCVRIGRLKLKWFSPPPPTHPERS